MNKFKINLEYFEKPKGKLINNIALKAYDFSGIELYCNKPCIFLTPYTSSIDKMLITKCLKSNYVFLKKSIVDKISLGLVQEDEKQILLDEIQSLTQHGLSVSIVWGLEPTIFGKNEKISNPLCLFLKETNLNLKILTFPNEFFAFPFWAQEPRKTKIFANQKLEIQPKKLIGLSKKSIVETIQNLTPSSANSYTSKFPLLFSSNNLATNLERVVYACPNCKKLLSLYSEFSCLKCSNCGNAIEISKDGKILFSPFINNFDDIENFQFTCLKKQDFNINKIIEYKDIIQVFDENCKKSTKIRKILQIYADKLILINPLTKKELVLNYENIEHTEYTFNNTLILTQKNAKLIKFFGKNDENLVIIKDLIKLNKN